MLGAVPTGQLAAHWNQCAARCVEGLRSRLTMWRGLVILTMTVCASVCLVAGAARAAPASARVDICTGSNVNFSGIGWYRSDNDVEGIRAPIDFRASGTICQPGGAAYAWIGIGPFCTQNCGQITQAGWAHTCDSSLGMIEYC